MDHVPLAGKQTELVAQGLDGVDGLGGLDRGGLFGLLVIGLGLNVDVGVGLDVRLDVVGSLFELGVVLDLGVGLDLVLDVQRGLLGGDTRLGVGVLGLIGVHSVCRLDDVELVLDGLDGVVARVQVRVRHGGCFFLDTKGGGTCENGRHPSRRRPPRGSAEDELDGFLEPIVNHGHQTDHDDDEDNHHGGVRRELVASGPDNLAEFRDDLTVEKRESAQRALLAALAALAGLLLARLVLGVRHVDGAQGVRHVSHLNPGRGRTAPGCAARRCI